MTKINGKEISLPNPTTIKDYLTLNNYRTEAVAVEINGNILPKSSYDSYVITEYDTIEIVSFVGGG